MIRVGYVPYSKDLTHPADRRRLASWASEKKIILNVHNPLDSDVLVLSNAANFGYWLKRAKQPVILDLVDAYIGEDPTFIRDFLRNLLRSVRGTSSINWLTYTRHLKKAIELSNCVIVASQEQRESLLSYNDNVRIILDDHSELDNALILAKRSVTNKMCNLHREHLFWEGFGYTIKHFEEIAQDLDAYLYRENLGLYLVTNINFPKWGGYLGNIETKALIRKLFPISHTSVHIINWTVSNVATAAANSTLGLIPIKANDKFGQLKSENKLLSMWHLGLLAIYSPIPSYVRTGATAGFNLGCQEGGEWEPLIQSCLNNPKLTQAYFTLSSKYLDDFHSHKILVSQWDEIIKSCLPN